MKNEKSSLAIKYIDQVLIIDPSDKEFWHYKLDCLEELQLYKEGITFIDEKFKLFAPDIIFYQRKIDLLKLLGNQPEAIKCIELIIEIEQKENSFKFLSCMYFEKAIIFAEMGKFAESIQSYEKCLEIYINHPNDVVIKRKIIAMLFYNFGRYEELLEFTKVLKVIDKKGDYHFIKGITLAALGNHAKAIDQYKKSNKSYILTDYQQGFSYYYLGNESQVKKKMDGYDEEKIPYIRYEATQPLFKDDRDEENIYYGALCQHLGQYQQAISYFDKIQPKFRGELKNNKQMDNINFYSFYYNEKQYDAMAYRNKAFCFLKLGNLEYAKIYIEKSLEIETNCRSLYYKGLIYEIEGNLSEALEHFKYAIFFMYPIGDLLFKEKVQESIQRVEFTQIKNKSLGKNKRKRIC